jgi:ribonuclease HI
MTEPRKPRRASWRELPPAEMASHLLATPTISDGAWTSLPRLPRETRPDFVRRVLLGETPESEPEMLESEAAEPATPKLGYYLLNTDGGNLRRRPGEPLTNAAIGALLRTRRLAPVAQISKPIGPATHNVAEYRALIEGLTLARRHGVPHIRVYTDSELVVDQVNGVSSVRQEHLQELHAAASGLVALFKSIRVSWVPREMNAAADRLVRDALGTTTRRQARTSRGRAPPPDAHHPTEMRSRALSVAVGLILHPSRR